MSTTKTIKLSPTPELIPTRDGFGKGVVRAGKQNKNVVVLCADLTESTRCLWFKEQFPNRFVEIGVAEQNMASVAAGMALVGKIPFIASYAVFSPGRNWEQIRTTICYNDANVKIIGAHAGLSVGPDGATHQALEDVALMRALPNMTVIVPCDAVEAEKATLAIAKHKGPCYLRLAREKTPVMTTQQTQFVIGKADIFWESEHPKVAILANGALVHEALVAAQELEHEGVQTIVINNHTIKPLDRETILAVARRCGAIVTAEEHQIIGGMGSAVAEFLSKTFPVPMRLIGVHDSFGESGQPAELMNKYQLTSKHIMLAVTDLLKHKHSFEQLPPAHRETTSAFQLHSGGTLRTIHSLYTALHEMPHETFAHHVAEGKNDFATWISDVFKDQKLATAVQRCGTKEELMSTLQQRLKL